MPVNPLEITGGIAIGTGVGAAVGDVVIPKLEDFKGDQWEKYPNKPPAAGVLAQGVAQGQIDEGKARAWAKRTGFGEEQFSALVSIANVGPGVAPAFELWRRGDIGEGQFRGALKRSAIEPGWIDQLVKLKTIRLSPAEIANAVQQGFVADAGLLPSGGGGGPPFDVPTEQVGLDPIEEAEASGVTRERLQVLAQLSGNPPGPMELLQMWNRGIIGEGAVEKGIREGRTKTKWTPALKEMRKAVLSAQEYASARLRTWVTPQESYDGGALTGHSKEQMDLLFLNRGRPASPTQMWRGWARKATGPTGKPVDYDDHAKAIAISDIRPEYAEMLWEIRFNYPSLFQLRRAVEDGSLDPERARTIMGYQLYEAQDIESLITSWTKAGTAALRDLTVSQLQAEYEGGYMSESAFRAQLAKLGYSANEQTAYVNLADAKRVAGQRDAAVTFLRNLFVKRKIDEPNARARLGQVGVDGTAVDQIIEIWNVEREAMVTELTAAQVKAAYKKGLIDRPTALAELEERGYSAADVGTYLDS